MMLIGPAIIGLVIYLIVKNTNHTAYRCNFSNRDNALELLNERYAKSEISDEEYERKKKVLNN